MAVQEAWWECTDRSYRIPVEARRHSVLLTPCTFTHIADQATPVAIDSANRWIDNLHALHDWLRKKFQGMDTQVTGLFKEVRGLYGLVEFGCGLISLGRGLYMFQV